MEKASVSKVIDLGSILSLAKVTTLKLASPARHLWRYTSIFDLWSRSWCVARLLGLRGVSPSSQPSEGEGSTTTTLNFGLNNANKVSII